MSWLIALIISLIGLSFKVLAMIDREIKKRFLGNLFALLLPAAAVCGGLIAFAYFIERPEVERNMLFALAGINLVGFIMLSAFLVSDEKEFSRKPQTFEEKSLNLKYHRLLGFLNAGIVILIFLIAFYAMPIIRIYLYPHVDHVAIDDVMLTFQESEMGIFFVEHMRIIRNGTIILSVFVVMALFRAIVLAKQILRTEKKQQESNPRPSSTQTLRFISGTFCMSALMLNLGLVLWSRRNELLEAARAGELAVIVFVVIILVFIALLAYGTCSNLVKFIMSRMSTHQGYDEV